MVNAKQLTQVQLDSLFTKFLQLRAPELLPEADRQFELTAEDRKCGFYIVHSLISNFDSFSNEKQTILKPLLQRPVLDNSIVTNSGVFRIHYDTIGTNVPAYIQGLSLEENINEIKNTLDSVYRFEVDYLNYPAPPSDNGAGGDDRYDFYIVNQGGNLYGYTEWENKVGTNNWTSFIVIDNDFLDKDGLGNSRYFSEGMDGANVTIAHEFHHAIQLGSYGIENSNGPFRDSDIFYYEITSTAMEEFVYDEVNDYYQYMDSYFRRTDRAFTLQSGYNLAIWNIFLENRFGFDLLKQQWELIPNQSAITAINNSLIIFGSSFPRELNEFGIWTFYTNYRAVPGLYFEEASSYPVVTPTTTIQFTPPSQHADMSSAPVANNFMQFNVITNGDTLIAIVTNGDAASNSNQFSPFQYTLFSNSSAGDRKLTDDYSSDFSTLNKQFWSVSEILNRVIVRSDSIVNSPTESKNFAFPNPFSYTKNSGTIYFTFDAENIETADLNIYSSGMQLVYRSEKRIVEHPETGQNFIDWNAFDNDNQKLASGVYIYVIKRGDDVDTGKIVIFNE